MVIQMSMAKNENGKPVKVDSWMARQGTGIMAILSGKKIRPLMERQHLLPPTSACSCEQIDTQRFDFATQYVNVT
jgi:hypothetical protein